jgi:hypothetical protein
MSDELSDPATKPKLIWADAPWTVAALLGVWGVMIGIEEFKLANVVMVLTALSCALRLFRDSIETTPRRISAFVVGLILIAVLLTLDFHFTKKKQISSEAKAQEVPSLTTQIGQLQATIAKQKNELEARDIREDQQLIDIKGQNTKLQQSVDTKDKALVDIAKHQYSLNFLPQVVVLWDNAANDIRIDNNGKTNITIGGLVLTGYYATKDLTGTPAFLAPGANNGFSITDVGKKQIMSQALATLTNEVRIEGVFFIQTLDEKKYEVSVTLHCIVKDGAISKSFIADKETKPSDWSGLQQ